MVDRRDVGSWIEGSPGPRQIQDWPGQRLGRPESGPGSIARLGRRIVALLIDWTIAGLIARLVFGGNQWGILAIFAAEQILLVGTVGSSIGHRLLGLRLERLGGGWAGPVRALIRTVLLAVVIPAAIWDADQRGLHDKAAGTVLTRTR